MVRILSGHKGKEYLGFDPRKIPSEMYNSGEGKIYRFQGKGKPLLINRGTSGLFGTSEIRKPLSISLEISPSSLQNTSVLLKRSIYRAGFEYGFELRLEKRSLVLILNRFFLLENGLESSETISSRSVISTSEWNHIILEFVPNRSEVILYLNSREVGRATGRSESVIGLGFHADDSTPLRIGEDYYGRLRSIRIAESTAQPYLDESKYTPDIYDPNSDTFEPVIGDAYSPIFTTKGSHSSLHRLEVNAKRENDQLLETWIRGSSRYFPANSSPYLPGLQWVRLQDWLKKPGCGQGDFKLNISENCFQFFQIRFRLKPDPIGKLSPEIYSARAEILSVPTPKPVPGFRIYPEGSDLENQKVCFRWVSSDDPNVFDGGGYRIHYGTQPNDSVAVVDIPSNFNKDKVRSNISSFCLDNSVITNQSELNAPDFHMPSIRPGQSVYFRISAYTRFWNRDSRTKDQLSPLSDPVLVIFPTSGQ
jgi:hypothetical protein